MARRRKRRSNWPRPKASTTARGYGAMHQAERKRWAPLVEAGYADCCRCGFPIAPGTAFHLDHRDDKLGYLGVSHARCNLKAAAKRGNELMRARKALNPPPSSRRVASRDW
jgi:hypothetical protein